MCDVLDRVEEKKDRNFTPFLLAICGQVVLYGIHYITIPTFLWISPYDTARNIGTIILSTILLSLVWMSLVSDRFSGWLVGIILYIFAIFLYYPDNAYGIGSGMFDFGVITVAILSFLVLVTEFVIWCTIKLLRKFLRK